MAPEKSKREVLADSPLFDNLLPPELAMLADLVTERDYQADDVVFSEGDVGDSLFVIADGTVQVLRKNSSSNPAVIAELSAPCSFWFRNARLLVSERRARPLRA